MQNTSCFPCVEHPMRCYIVSLVGGQRFLFHPCKTGMVSAQSAGFFGIQSISNLFNREWSLEPLYDPEAGPVFKLWIQASRSFLAVEESTGRLCAVMETEVKMGRRNLWVLEEDPEDECSVQIKSVVTNMYLSKKITDSVPENIQMDLSGSTWKLDYLTGELCSLELAARMENGDVLQLHNGKSHNGNDWINPPTFTGQGQGYGRCFRFTEAGGGAGHVRISYYGSAGKYNLMCNGSGQLTMSKERLNDDTLWLVEAAPFEFDGVTIKSVKYGRFLGSNGGNVIASERFCGLLSTWQPRPAHDNRYCITSTAVGGGSLFMDAQGTVKVNFYVKGGTLENGATFVWELHEMSDGCVLFMSQNQQKPLHLDGEEEPMKWRIIPCPTGIGVCLIKVDDDDDEKEDSLALSRNLSLVSTKGPSESWNLVPTVYGISGLSFAPYAVARTPKVKSEGDNDSITAAPQKVTSATSSSGSILSPAHKNRPFCDWRFW